MHIGLQGGLNVGVAEPGLYVLHISAGFNQDRGVGVPQGMIIKSKKQFLVDHPCTILEGIRGSVFSVFRYADHTDTEQGRFDTFLDGNNALSGMAKYLVYNTHFTKEQIRRILINTNSFVFADPLEDAELDIILREENFKDLEEVPKLSTLNAAELFGMGIKPVEFTRCVFAWHML